MRAPTRSLSALFHYHVLLFIADTRRIVALHGLNGHCEKTWTAGNGVHWLRDLLPHDLPRARILSGGYDANTHSGLRVSCQYLSDHAQTLVSDLCLERQITEVRSKRIRRQAKAN